MYACIDSKALELTEMADDIFDHPELGLSEFRASGLLTSWLEKEGFQVEKGVGGLETALRLSSKKARAVRISDFSASMTRFRALDMPAAITCRDRLFRSGGSS